MDRELLYSSADESELNELLAGRQSGFPISWSPHSRLWRNGDGFGVIWERNDSIERPVRPYVLIARDEALRRLFGRFSQLRSDLSPLTSWCHLLTPEQCESLDSLTRTPRLEGYEAAWTGLAIAETLLLSDLKISDIRISACLATQTFAFARAFGLWGAIGTEELLRKFDLANHFFRPDDLNRRSSEKALRVRACLRPIWECLAFVSSGKSLRSTEARTIGGAVENLKRARENGHGGEFRELLAPLLSLVRLPASLSDFDELPPIARLRLFDELMSSAAFKEPPESAARIASALVAGYLSTKAAGGEASLGLAEHVSDKWPEVLAWAYVLGGVGESVFWTSSFDGLGRLVARELVRPLRLDEPPAWDIYADEAFVLVDPKLKDPFVHLRIKSRLITVGLLPGVYTMIAVGEPRTQQPPKQENIGRSMEKAPSDLLNLLADALWPIMQKRMNSSRRSQGNSADEVEFGEDKRKKAFGQKDLPLKNSKNRF